MKKYISIIIALLILTGTIIFNKRLTSGKKKREIPHTEVSQVRVSPAAPSEKEIIIKVQGVLKAKESIDIVPEVQGIMLRGTKEFKPGTFYKKGETIVSIDPGEFLANLRSLKSNLTGILTAALPDIKMDFPDAYDKWLHFLQGIDMNNPLPPLPGFQSDKEKFFITGRKILSTYYQVKNAEIRLSKYRIKSPISGYLSQVMIAPGSMVRPGQKLGILKDLSKFEMETDIP
jgi:multidrug efflux pump subunit AcrA (membrane-fusion protein)